MTWIFIIFMAAFISVLLLHPTMVLIAKEKGITDKPDERKLQRAPVPVLGGVAVFFGIVVGVGCAVPFYGSEGMTVVLALLTLMLYTGTMDDIVGLSAAKRFAIETVAVLAAIFIGGYLIRDFYGLWGVYGIPEWAGIPLTVFASVGIINAINLIDGVDGLSSGYCMMTCAVFGAFFLVAGDTMMAVLAAACIGALIPFFGHNVFGKRSKMFIGDGGTLMMGMTMSLFVLKVLEDGSFITSDAEHQFGFIPFTLAALSIPVFDTLRVIFTRIIRKTSPFKPDKKHLHHAFIELGFSHFATTLSILALNAAVVGLWYLLYRCGCSTDTQLYCVAATAFVFTFGTYLCAHGIVVRRTAKSRTEQN